MQTTAALQTERFLSARCRELPVVCSKETAARVAELERAGRDVLPLKPYPDVPLPPHVIEAAERAIRENRSVPGTGAPALKDAISAKLLAETGSTYDRDQVVITSGAMQALNLIFRVVLDPGDEVLYNTPSYFFFGGIQMVGGVPVTVPTDEATAHRWDLEAIERAVTPRTKLLAVHSPVNPTGVVLTIEELAGLAEIAERHDLLMLYDESYDRLVYDGRRHRSPAELPRARERLIVVQSLTKSFAMSPWRVGYAVAPAWLAAELGKLLEWEQLMVNHAAQAAAVAAIAGPRDWLARVPGVFERNRDVVWSAIDATPGLRSLKPEGGPFLFISAPGLGLSGDELRSRLLAEHGIPTERGAFFGSPAHVRLALWADQDVIDEAAARLQSLCRD